MATGMGWSDPTVDGVGSGEKNGHRVNRSATFCSGDCASLDTRTGAKGPGDRPSTVAGSERGYAPVFLREDRPDPYPTQSAERELIRLRRGGGKKPLLYRVRGV